MKKAIFITFILTTFFNCKNEELTLLKGEFIYYGDAAVLQTSTEIYGVLITDKMLELNNQVKKHKTKPTDMVPVEIKGIITNKKHDKILWEKKVEIVEIITITQPKSKENNVLKLGKE